MNTNAFSNKNSAGPDSGRKKNAAGDTLREGIAYLIFGVLTTAIDYVISTSKHGRQPTLDSVRLRRKAVERSICCLTSLDTANAVLNCLAMEKTIDDVELVDITTL